MGPVNFLLHHHDPGDVVLLHSALPSGRNHVGYALVLQAVAFRQVHGDDDNHFVRCSGDFRPGPYRSSVVSGRGHESLSEHRRRRAAKRFLIGHFDDRVGPVRSLPEPPHRVRGDLLLLHDQARPPPCVRGRPGHRRDTLLDPVSGPALPDRPDWRSGIRPHPCPFSREAAHQHLRKERQRRFEGRRDKVSLNASDPAVEFSPNHEIVHGRVPKPECSWFATPVPQLSFSLSHSD